MKSLMNIQTHLRVCVYVSDLAELKLPSSPSPTSSVRGARGP